MRLPHEMKEPGPLFRPWLVPLVGIGVLLLVLLFFATIPLDATHEPVQWRDGPRARFLGVTKHTPEPWIFIDREGTIRTAHAAVAPENLDAVVRSRPKVAVRSHRSAPWSPLRTLLQASERAKQESLSLEIVSKGGHRTHLSVVLREARDGDRIVPVDAVPPPDPNAVRRHTDEHYRGWPEKDTVPLVLRFDPPGTTTMQDVLSAWECYVEEGSSLVVLTPLR